jgi:hypothetical protein
MGETGRGLIQIAFMFGSIGLIGMLVAHSRDTATVVNSVGKTFAGVLSVATMQSDYNNLFSA